MLIDRLVKFNFLLLGRGNSVPGARRRKKCVHYVLNYIIMGNTCNTNNVELVVERNIELAQIYIRAPYHVVAFGGVNRLHRIIGKDFASLYFHKNYACAFLRYDVNFKTAPPPFALAYGASERYEIVGSNLFAPVAFVFFVDRQLGRISVFDLFGVSHSRILFAEQLFKLLNECLACLAAHKTDVLLFAILEEEEHWD